MAPRGSAVGEGRARAPGIGLLAAMGLVTGAMAAGPPLPELDATSRPGVEPWVRTGLQAETVWAAGLPGARLQAGGGRGEDRITLQGRPMAAASWLEGWSLRGRLAQQRRPGLGLRPGGPEDPVPHGAQLKLGWSRPLDAAGRAWVGWDQDAAWSRRAAAGGSTLGARMRNREAWAEWSAPRWQAALAFGQERREDEPLGREAWRWQELSLGAAAGGQAQGRLSWLQEQRLAAPGERWRGWRLEWAWLASPGAAGARLSLNLERLQAGGGLRDQGLQLRATLPLDAD